MHQALYRRFRPEIFSEILGQEHIVRILQNQIKSGTVGHAYLFCGTRGTGKTTTARILAKGVNCTADITTRPCGKCDNCIAIKDGIFLDVIEIDAASNNGVENIRELRESVKYAPVTGRFKVYIIDEVHMLSAGAYNALLKTLEEPPEYVIFILATTEPQKLPATILSRCMRLDFRRVSEKLLIESMKEICRDLNTDISEDALGIIAANGDGSVRDSLSLLDQCLAGSGEFVSREDVINILGTKGEEAFIKITDMVEEGKAADVLLFINEIISEGIEVGQFVKDWMSHYRNLMMIKYVRNPENILNLSKENIERVREQSERIHMSSIDYNILKLADTALEIKWSTQPRVLLELCAIKLAAKGDFKGNDETAMDKEGGYRLGKQIDSKCNDETATARGVTIAKVKEQSETTQIHKDFKEESVKSHKDFKEEPSKEKLSKEEPFKGATPQELPDKKIDNKPRMADGILENLDKVWAKIVEEGASTKGSLRILGNRCRPLCIEGNCLRLELDSEIAMRYVKDNSDLLRDLIKKYVGKELMTECILNEDKGQTKQQKTAVEKAAEVSNRLNINVEVK